MKKRIIKYILLTITVLAFVLSLSYYYGLFSEYNYFTAKKDIKNGIVRLIQYGEPNLPLERITDSIAGNYGFRQSGSLGCSVTGSDIIGVEIYNNTVKEYLKTINSPDWEEKFSADIEKAIKILEVKPE